MVHMYSQTAFKDVHSSTLNIILSSHYLVLLNAPSHNVSCSVEEYMTIFCFTPLPKIALASFFTCKGHPVENEKGVYIFLVG